MVYQNHYLNKILDVHPLRKEKCRPATTTPTTPPVYVTLSGPPWILKRAGL